MLHSMPHADEHHKLLGSVLKLVVGDLTAAERLEARTWTQQHLLPAELPTHMHLDSKVDLGVGGPYLWISTEGVPMT